MSKAPAVVIKRTYPSTEKLNAAKDAHTDAAWRKLNWVAGNSETLDARRQAEMILAEW